MCYAEMRRYPEALEDAEAVISAKPKWVNGYLRKAGALFAMARFEDARRTYEQGMESTGERYDENLKDGKQACVDVMMRAVTEAGRAADGRPGYPRGTTVVLTGLTAKPELNGKVGKVVFDPLRGGANRPTARVNVRLDDDGRELALKGVNLCARTSGGGSDDENNEKNNEENDEDEEGKNRGGGGGGGAGDTSAGAKENVVGGWKGERGGEPVKRRKMG